MDYTVEKVDESTQGEMVTFLKQHEDYTLFLLGNSEAYGTSLTDEPNSGNYKLIRSADNLLAVFCLSRRGTILVHSLVHEQVYPLILDSCQQEGLPIGGVIGKWDFASGFWEFLKKENVIQSETLISKEVLYTLELENVNYEDEQNARLLVQEDFDQWLKLRNAYLDESRSPSRLSIEQIKKEFLEKVEKKITWGFFVDGTMVAIADLNAKALDLGQVGGVFTNPEYRRRGISKSLMRQLLRDAQKIHGIRKVIIFTGDTNIPAQKVYESLGVEKTGNYALLFGNSKI